MRRRTFVGSVGVVGSIAVIGYASREVEESIDVRFWLSERASRYPAVRPRVREYLEFALDLPDWSVSISHGGVVSVSTENGARVTSNGEWPGRLLAGRVGRGGIDPASDVNLLVTDGRMDQAPTGYGTLHVASVGGARHFENLEPIDEQPDPVPLTTPNFVAQVLIHEVGHALGLAHDHGVAFRKGDAIVATPMLSAYAWDESFERDPSMCPTVVPDPARDRSLSRALTYRFSSCAQRRLREYRGGIPL